MAAGMGPESKQFWNTDSKVEKGKTPEEKEISELPDQIGEKSEAEDLPDSIGDDSTESYTGKSPEEKEISELPDQIGEKSEAEDLPDSIGDESAESNTGKTPEEEGISELPNQIGEKSEAEDLPDSIGDDNTESNTGKNAEKNSHSSDDESGAVSVKKQDDGKNDEGTIIRNEEIDDNNKADGVQKDVDHNSETSEDELKIQDYLDGKISFNEVKEIFAKYYADAVNSNKPWSWNENVPGGDRLTASQKKAIKEYAQDKGLIPKVSTRVEDGKTYADFSDYMAYETILDEENWEKTDQEQVDQCNKDLKEAIENDSELAKKFTEEQLEDIRNGKTPSGYTWHHSEKDGRMQLVPFGIHNSTNHNGGRSEGNWADAPRH